MSSHNNQVRELLAYYLSLDFDPQYAVMLKGPWGSGKTFFIKRFMKEQLGDRRYLYVSLYGLSETAMIGEEIYRQVHPVLGSKAFAIGSKIAQSVLKFNVKTDLLGHHGSMDSSIPQIDFKDFIKDGQGLIFVFDDLERCRIPMGEVLGYINSFVEHEQAKVIIVANEDELEVEIDGEGRSESYGRIKEKLIGKVVSVEPNVQDALNAFLDEVPTDHRMILKRYETAIHRVYKEGGFGNLRSLRQSILDFSRLLTGLHKHAIESAELLEALLERFLILSMEIKAGELAAVQIPSSSIDLSTVSGRPRSPQEETVARLKQKYVVFSNWKPILTVEIWRSMFDTGLFDFEQINSALLLSSYLRSEGTPDWARLWYGQDLADDEFSATAARVYQALTEKTFEQLGVIRHVVGMLLAYSRDKVFHVPPQDILAAGKAQIDELIERNKLLRQDENDAGPSLLGWAGLGFQGKDLPEYQTFSQYIKSAIDQAKQDELPARATDLLNVMVTDSSQFARLVLITNAGGAQFYDLPIFTYIEPRRFADALIALEGEDARTVAAVFRDRYRGGNFAAALSPEREWLDSVASMLAAERDSRTGKVSALRLNMLCEALIFAKGELQNVLDEAERERRRQAGEQDD